MRVDEGVGGGTVEYCGDGASSNRGPLHKILLPRGSATIDTRCQGVRHGLYADRGIVAQEGGGRGNRGTGGEPVSSCRPPSPDDHLPGMCLLYHQNQPGETFHVTRPKPSKTELIGQIGNRFRPTLWLSIGDITYTFLRKMSRKDVNELLPSFLTRQAHSNTSKPANGADSPNVPRG